MKKAMGIIAALAIFFSSPAFAGGDQNCGDKASGPAGDTGKGNVEQNQPPAD